MNAFRRLISVNIANHQSTASISAHLDDILDKLETIHIKFTRDNIAGLVLQNGLASDSQLAEEFNRRVELAYQSSADARIMDFDTMIRLIDVIRHQQSLSQPPRISQTADPPTLALHADLDASHHSVVHPPNANSPPPHPDNTPDAYDFMAIQAGLCWQCPPTTYANSQQSTGTFPTSRPVSTTILPTQTTHDI
ncbi:hypothetical protein VP01_1224g9 [Puccinia sorghi]|uniref:Uncharacterized protein n=1 Tax=Puccinia sorghi TaxID=27349 RepID=A0A0L6VQ58_9BASI|nr:hypothetical protein VP01_1224g9 [Puccinia sorghi]